MSTDSGLYRLRYSGAVAVRWADEDMPRPWVTIYDGNGSIEIDWRDVSRLAAWLQTVCDGRDGV